MKKDKSGFSIIEVMIGIFVFGLGLTSVFMMLSGSITMSDYSRNLIIASHLANEELELFKNIRDSNYIAGKRWNYINPGESYSVDSPHFKAHSYYTLENNYSKNALFPIKVTELSNFEEGENNVIPYMDTNYKLCLNEEGSYTYDCSFPNVPTSFYRYLHITPADYDDGGTIKTIDNAFKVSSKVIWVHGGYHSTEVNTVITDWKRY